MLMILEKIDTPLLMLGFGAPGIQELIVIGLILGLNGLWIWSLIHCVKNPRLSDNNRIIGVILIAILWLLGSVIYLFLPRQSPDQS